MLVGCTLLRAKTILLMIFEIKEKVLIVIQTEEYTDKICELCFIGRVLKTESNEVISWPMIMRVFTEKNSQIPKHF